MTLRLALSFLFHQPLGERAEQANRICYRGVLSVLRNHPRLKFNIMISGTLLDALCWFDPAFLKEIRSGLQDGTFRLLGSTHAQTLLLAADDGDTVRQISVHRDTLKKYFDVEPAAFWSPQSTWAPRFAPLLARSGYRSLALEGRALHAAGATAPLVYRTISSEGDLSILWDDAIARNRMDFGAWFHRPEILQETFSEWKRHPDSDRLFPVIAEDAAAFGLWGYETGLDPRADAAGLDGILDWIEREPGVECAFWEDAPEAVAPLLLEKAVWSSALDRAFSDPEYPLREEGYRDWNDFLLRAPRLLHFRRMHSAVRVHLTSAKSANSPMPESKKSGSAPQAGADLLALAERVFCTHQDGFGNVGVGGRGDPAWEGISATIAVAKAAEFSCVAPENTVQGIVDDVTGDGEDEILLRRGDHLVILSPSGGRLLHWFDLRRGQLHVGNPLAVPIGSLLIEARSPEFTALPDDWLPKQDDPLPESTLEGGERRLIRLAKEHLPLESGPLPIWLRPRSAALKPSLPARRRALNDFFSFDDGPEEIAEPRLDFRLADGAVTFLRFFGYRLRMVKRVSLTARGVRAIYRFRNVNQRPVHVRMRLVSEVCPDYLTVCDSPGWSYEPVTVGPRHSPALKNSKTGTVLVSHISRPTSEPAASHPGILACELDQTVAFTVEPGRTEVIIARLDLFPAAQAVANPPIAATIGNSSSVLATAEITEGKRNRFPSPLSSEPS